ncbi:phosphotransferase [Limibacter armeniacum]|uniref:phosphotransferase n=1 Tax=Limibacter armeniacum TaxID=466084 RepID=UPI002FE59C0B
MKFEAIDSILSPLSISIFLTEKYGLSDRNTCRILRTGINHTYLATDNEKKYVFRIYSYNWRTEIDIQEELKLLNHLHDNAIPVSYPIADSVGQYIHKVEAPEGIRYTVLFSYAEGEKVRNLSLENCGDLGVLMGRMHQLTVNRTMKRVNYNVETLTHLPYQLAKEHFEESFEEMGFVRDAIALVEAAFKDVETVQLRFGTVHLDFWYDNMNLEQDGKITVFDFDFCGNGWLLLDIAYFMMQLFLTAPDKDLFELKAAAFYKGYATVAEISEQEKQLLPVAGLAIWIFYLGVQSSRFDNWSNIFLTKNYLKHFMGMAKSWLSYNKVEVIS